MQQRRTKVNTGEGNGNIVAYLYVPGVSPVMGLWGNGMGSRWVVSRCAYGRDDGYGLGKE